MKLLSLSVLVCAFALPMAAGAQWQWLDQQGKKVFSDQPPSADIPEKNILRRPNGQAAPAPVVAADGAASDGAKPANAPAPVAAKGAGVDKELEEKKRKTEEAEKAKRDAEAQKVAKAKAENCTRARQGKATMDSGIRIARVNDKGEREILDDKARAEEDRRLQSVIQADCGK